MKETLELYQQVFKVANFFLKKSKFHTLQELNEHEDPTYESVAERAQMLASILAQLSASGGWDEQRVSANAHQAAILMHEMATAIRKENQESLEAARKKLEEMTFI